ncbi:MAG: hypothetical protein FWG14_13615, partial [Peptococcaceae bacterium]|nr:hypothetical protein [Peptococcaceae bacterium]
DDRNAKTVTVEVKGINKTYGDRSWRAAFIDNTDHKWYFYFPDFITEFNLQDKYLKLETLVEIADGKIVNDDRNAKTVTVEINGISKTYTDHVGTPFIDGTNNKWYVIYSEFLMDFKFYIYFAPKIFRDYKLVAEIAVREGLATVHTVDGQVFYEFNDEFVWDNYGNNWTGMIVLTAIDGDMNLFIRRNDVNGISIPFGFFEPDLFQTLFTTGWTETTRFVFYHYRSNGIPLSLEDRKGDMEKIATYYALRTNSERAGLIILKYLGYVESLETGIPKTNFTNEELDAIAGRWSGSSGRSNFCHEIEAHADLLLDNDIRANAVKALMMARGRTEEDYYNSVGCADLAFGDNNVDKLAMDILWGP